MDVFYLTGDVVYTASRGCSLRVFGITETGKNVAVLIHGFHDWVDIRVPYHARNMNDKELETMSKALVSQLNRGVAKRLKSSRLPWVEDSCVCVGNEYVPFDELEILDQKRLMHYHTDADTFLRLYVRVPMLLDAVQKALKSPLSYEDEEYNRTIDGWLSSELAYNLFRVDALQSRSRDPRNASVSFELHNGANMDFRLKCDQTMELRPCGWFRMTEGIFTRSSREWSDHDDEFHIQYKRGFRFQEVDKPIPSEQIRCAGFDIECIGTDGRFPKPTENPIITISICFHTLATMQISNNSKKELVVNGGDTMTRYALQLGTVLGASEESNTLILSDTTPCDVFSNCVEKPASTTCICFPYNESSSDSRNNAEKTLLLEFVRLLAEYGPHVIVTYNGNAFDTPYILKRADVLGIGGVVRKKLSWGSSERRGVRQLVQQKWDKCEALGLVSIGRGAAFAPDALVCIEKEVTTTAFGTQIRKNVVIPGKVNFDLMCWWKLNVQESYYTLGGLSQKYIKRSKKDLPYHLLPFRFKTPEGRLEIVEYCVMDTVLTMYLASLKVAIVMFMSMSYVQMVDISQKFQSGQGYCALSMLIREINERVKGGGLPYAIPENATLSEEVDIMESAEDDADGDDEEAYETIKSKGASDKVGYQGATVLDSVSGIYDDCIACCDFASLYPSIMMAHNLSYETHLEKVPDGWEGQAVRPDPRGFDGWELGDAKARTKPDRYDYQIMRNGQRFVAKKHHVGLLASIVEKLIQARKAVRAQMKKETSDSILVALEQRQLSIKYAANSVYGAAGARKGKLPSATFIAETVTNEGRAMIDTIKFVAENIYLCNGVEILHKDLIPSTDDPSKWFNMQVIYGDTDSIFILQKGVNRQASRDGTVDIAKYCTTLFPTPVALEFEKLSDRSVFKDTKKRYALNLYDDKFDDDDAGKVKVRGMSLVRRDNFRFKQRLEKTLLDIILNKRKPLHVVHEESLRFAQTELQRLVDGNVPYFDLLVNVSLTKPLEAYGDSDASPKLVAARRMIESDPNARLQAGDRFDILMCLDKNQSPNAKKSDFAYDVKTALRKNVPLHWAFYVESCEQCVCSLLGLFYKEYELKQIKSQRTLDGTVLTRESLKTIKPSSSRALGFTKRRLDDAVGYDKAKQLVFGALRPAKKPRPTLFGKAPPVVVKETKEELEREIQGYYKNLGATWDGRLDDPIDIFSTSDENLYKRFVAIQKLKLCNA